MRQVYLFIPILLALTLISCNKVKEERSIKGNLIFVIGNVEISNKAGSNPAKKNDPISEGDTIKTGDKSVAVIQFENDAASVEIQENAEFSISKFNPREQELISAKGNFWIKAKKLNKESNFNVVMPTAVAGIRGTSFYAFEVKEEGIHGICHCQGAVDFQDKVTNYKGNHDTDYSVLTRNGKTITLTPEDFKAAGVKFNSIEHKHSSIDNSPVGKKGELTDEQFMRLKKIALKKFAEI
ncbi:MAG: FecR domain-containing protein [Leptospiraceae bacterium]|nr:FecR domain-containing protein [Leptospiraceae bacterium]